MTVELVIFDLDGTLHDLAVDWDAAREIVGIAGTPERLGDAVERLIAADDQARLDALTAHELHAVAGHTLDPSVAEMLGRLRERTHVAIWTRNSKQVAAQLLHSGGVAPVLVVGREDGGKLKPDPTGVEKILSHFGCPAERALMVGDTWHDVEAARRAGIPSVLVGDSEAVRALGAQQTVAHVAQVELLLGSAATTL